MQSESHLTEARSATLESSYSYTEVGGSTTTRAQRANLAPSGLFRYRVIKRVMDIGLVLLTMPLLLSLIGIVSAMVVLSSPGPIFYSHRRVRRSGSFFSMWKFRTMCVNSAEVLENYLSRHPEARSEWNKTHKLRNDPRITPIGSFLRRYSVDELPQLWNVLRGDMSLVGPRPIVAAEVEKYGACFECYCRVKPGLTGLWQVSGRSQLSYEARVAIDCQYVKTWSLRRDFVIVLKTFLSVANQDGAY